MTDHPDVPRQQRTEYPAFECGSSVTYAEIKYHAESLIERFGVHPTDMKVTIEFYDYNPSELIFEFKRDETEEEYQKRVSYFEKDKARKIAKKKSQRERELAQLAALKAKYEGQDSDE